MKRSELILELGGDDSQPRYLRLAAALLAEIERGRLRPGDMLPGTRALSVQLGLHRNTVWNIERGLSPASSMTLYRVYLALGVADLGTESGKLRLD